MSNVRPHERLQTVNLGALSHAQARTGRPSSGGRRTIVAVAAVRRRRSGGLSVLRRPARRRFSSEERLAHVCSMAVPSLKPSLNTKDKQPQLSFTMLRSCISLALRSTAAPGRWGRAGTGFARAGGGGAFAHAAKPMLMTLGMLVCSSVRPNPSVERTHNGGARLLAPPALAAPSCAAHLKR